MSKTYKLTTFTLIAICPFLVIFATAQSAQQQPDEATAILRCLNQTVSWYRSVLLQQQMASDAADLVFAENSRSIALQTLRLTFDFGHSASALLQEEAKKNNAAETPSDSNTPQSKNLAQLAVAAQARVKQAQNDLDALERQAQTAPDKQRRVLENQIAEQHSELDLAQARYQALASFVDFANTSGGTSATGLLGKINELERTVPEARSTKNPDAASGTSANTQS